VFFSSAFEIDDAPFEEILLPPRLRVVREVFFSSAFEDFL